MFVEEDVHFSEIYKPSIFSFEKNRGFVINLKIVYLLHMTEASTSTAMWETVTETTATSAAWMKWVTATETIETIEASSTCSHTITSYSGIFYIICKRFEIDRA
jgi:hypothetical protein